MRYIIGFLISVGLLILVFVMIFRGGDETAPGVRAPRQLLDYANTTTAMQYVDDYAITADQTHRQVVITVDNTEVTLTVEKGYEGTIVRSQTYQNNPQAYANFLRALQIAGYNRGRLTDAVQDERGFCPTGHRYIFEIRDGSRSIQRLWTTSCGGDVGTFEGKSSTVRNLFEKQVPDYSKLVSGIDKL